MSNYQEYASTICNDFISIQEDFVNKYELDNYEDWQYDEETTLFTFSSKENSAEIHFNYVPIGSYSKNSGTWLWAWNNKENLHENKLLTLAIKKFGETKNYTELTEGYFEADEYIGWELTAIAYHFIEAIGAYRIETTDNLEIFFLLIKEIASNEVENLKKDNEIKTAKRIECEKHGKSRVAFVCQHLNKTTNLGFEESFETKIGMDLGVEDDLSAWCNKCEEVRLRYNGWNDENMEFAKIRLVCEGCYFEIKEANKL